MSSIVTYKGTDWSLLEKTNNYIIRPPLIDREYSSTCYPSNASAWVQMGQTKVLEGGCNRAAYYRMIGEPPTNQSGEYMAYILEHGKFIETFLISKWKEMGIWVNNNVKFFTEKYGFPISGEVDAFISKIPGSKDVKDVCIVEIKSYYKWYKRTQLETGKPSYSNLFQVMLYLDYYSEIGIKKGKLLYTARDEAKQFEFDITLRKHQGKTYPCIDGVMDMSVTLEGILERYQDLWGKYQRREMPARDFKLIYDEKEMEERYEAGLIGKTKYNDFKKGKTVGDFNCHYCNYTDLCWGDQAPAYAKFLIE